MKEEEICHWDDYANRSTLIIIDGVLYLAKKDANYKKPSWTTLSKKDAAERIATEMYDFTQEDLVKLSKYGLIKDVLTCITKKFTGEMV